MYFSVLPLVLLFTSTICASPVPVEHRSNSISAISINRRGSPSSHGLPSSKRNTDVYRLWDESRKEHTSQWSANDKGYEREGVRLNGMLCTLLRLTKPNIPPVETIDNDKQVLGWGWNEEPHLNEMIPVVIIAKKPAGHETLEH